MKMLGQKTNWRHPYGDGKAGEKIVEILTDRVFNGYGDRSRNENRDMGHWLNGVVGNGKN
jgi:hypothetical protein